MSLSTEQYVTATGHKDSEGAIGGRPRALPPTYWTSSTGVSVAIRGEGTPVFLMHGIGGSAGSCAALAQELSGEGYLTICWDAPGYGDSADPLGDVDHPKAAWDVLAELGVGRAHLIGTSWGGVIATRLAANHPDLVRSIVLMDSTRGSGRTAESARRMLDRLPELEAIGARAFAEQRAVRLVSPGASEGIARAVRDDMSRIRLPGYGAAARMMATTDTSADLTRITVPSFVVVGEDDIVTGVEESRILAQSIPGAVFAAVPDAGHAAIQEKPREISRLILDFWKKLS